MVILIGGTGSSGKTYLANRLMKKMQIPYLSVDHLMMGIFRGRPDCGFHPMDSYRKIGTILWPMIEGIIKTNIENEHDLIIEGVQLLPTLIKELEEPYIGNVKALFLLYNDEYIDNNYISHIQKFRNVIEKRLDDNLSIAELKKHSLELKQECLETGTMFLEIKKNYEESLQSVINTLNLT